MAVAEIRHRPIIAFEGKQDESLAAMPFPQSSTGDVEILTGRLSPAEWGERGLEPQINSWTPNVFVQFLEKDMVAIPPHFELFYSWHDSKPAPSDEALLKAFYRIKSVRTIYVSRTDKLSRVFVLVDAEFIDDELLLSLINIEAAIPLAETADFDISYLAAKDAAEAEIVPDSARPIPK